MAERTVTMAALKYLIAGGVLGCMSVSTIAQRGADASLDNFRYVTDDVYIEECGACHLAYPPQLLPIDVWRSMLAELDTHFGENAELDGATQSHLEDYLASHALGVSPPSRMSRMMHAVPADPPLRITEFPAFIETHAVIKKQLRMDTFPEGFLSPCGDCHRQARAAIFDKELLHPGYGPSVWGGPRDDAL